VLGGCRIAYPTSDSKEVGVDLVGPRLLWERLAAAGSFMRLRRLIGNYRAFAVLSRTHVICRTARDRFFSGRIGKVLGICSSSRIFRIGLWRPLGRRRKGGMVFPDLDAPVSFLVGKRLEAGVVSDPAVALVVAADEQKRDFPAAHHPYQAISSHEVELDAAFYGASPFG